MIKLRKGNLILLGLSDENMNRLKIDNPIKFNLKELGLQDIDVVIFNGRTEEGMYMEFRDGIGPDTEVKGCPTKPN
jgi:hypothetical protein